MLKNELLDVINQLSLECRQWNVQHGEFTSSIDAQRDMFNDLAVHALTVDGLANLTIDGQPLTVEQLANGPLTVRGLAVWSGNHYMGAGYVQPGLEA